MTSGTAAGSINAYDLENGLAKAVTDVISTMLNCPPLVVSSDSSIIVPGLSAIVGFGGKISGFIALHITPENACALATGLLGMVCTEVDEIVSDAMGEVVNMLAGGLKKHASRNEELFKISIPSVIRGNDYSTHALQNSEQRVLGVQADACSLAVQLVVEQ
jgi:chemotaxis protein CheX